MDQWKGEILRFCADFLTEQDLCFVKKATDKVVGRIVIIPYSIIERVVDQGKISPEAYGLVIADESHNLKSPDAQRTKTVLPFLKRAQVAICLTGTPAVNRPVELFTQLSGLLPSVFTDYKDFILRYCDAKPARYNPAILEAKGSSHEAELKLLLEQLVMIRRLKADVVQLPTKMREARYVDADAKYLAELLRIQKQSVALENDFKDPRKSDEERQMLKNAKEKSLLLLYQLTGLSKIKAIKVELFRQIEEARVERAKEHSRLDTRRLFEGDEDDGDGAVVDLRALEEDAAMVEERQRTWACVDLCDEDLMQLDEAQFQPPTASTTATAAAAASATDLVDTDDEDGTAARHRSTPSRKKLRKSTSPTSTASRKILVFAHHQRVLDAIEHVLREANVGYVRVDGKTTSAKKSRFIEQFQTDPAIDVALLAITACGTGLNMTVANVAIFAELYWSPGVVLQAEDRIHRIGQTSDEVKIIYILARNTADDIVWEQISRKQSMLEATIGNGGHHASIAANATSNRATTTSTAASSNKKQTATPSAAASAAVAVATSGRIDAFLQPKTPATAATVPAEVPVVIINRAAAPPLATHAPSFEQFQYQPPTSASYAAPAPPSYAAPAPPSYAAPAPPSYAAPAPASYAAPAPASYAAPAPPSYAAPAPPSYAAPAPPSYAAPAPPSVAAAPSTTARPTPIAAAPKAVHVDDVLDFDDDDRPKKKKKVVVTAWDTVASVASVYDVSSATASSATALSTPGATAAAAASTSYSSTMEPASTEPTMSATAAVVVPHVSVVSPTPDHPPPPPPPQLQPQRAPFASLPPVVAPPPVVSFQQPPPTYRPQLAAQAQHPQQQPQRQYPPPSPPHATATFAAPPPPWPASSHPPPQASSHANRSTAPSSTAAPMAPTAPTAAAPSMSLTQEQLDRIERNRQEALRKRQLALERAASSQPATSASQATQPPPTLPAPQPPHRGVAAHPTASLAAPAMGAYPSHSSASSSSFQGLPRPATAAATYQPPHQTPHQPQHQPPPSQSSYPPPTMAPRPSQPLQPPSRYPPQQPQPPPQPQHPPQHQPQQYRPPVATSHLPRPAAPTAAVAAAAAAAAVAPVTRPMPTSSSSALTMRSSHLVAPAPSSRMMPFFDPQFNDDLLSQANPPPSPPPPTAQPPIRGPPSSVTGGGHGHGAYGSLQFRTANDHVVKVDDAVAMQRAQQLFGPSERR
eukprot:gene7095-5103_t